MGTLKRIFIDDFVWKLLSLAAAVVLWFVGMNMNNPVQNYTVRQSLNLNNIEFLTNESIVLLNEAEIRSEIIQVGLRAPRNEMEFLRVAEISDPSLFDNWVEISIDFRSVNIESVRKADGITALRVDISPNLYPGLEHFSIRPSYVEVLLDTVDRRVHNIEIDIVGEVPPGFELQPISLQNSIVTISGSRTDMRLVDRVSVTADLTGQHEDVERLSTINVYDVDGNIITDRLNLSVTETIINKRIWPIRTVETVGELLGVPANGFAVTGFDITPAYIEVVGRGDIPDSVINISANIYGLEADTDIVLPISNFLPQGVQLRQNEVQEAVFTVYIEPIVTMTVSIPRDNIRILGVSAVYHILGTNAPFNIGISGPRSLVGQVTPNDISLELDLRTLAVGEHLVHLAVTVPEGLTNAGAVPSVNVQISSPADLNEANNLPQTVIPTLTQIPTPIPTPTPAPNENEDEDEE